MGASKRSNYTQRNSGVDVARNLGIVAGLGGLSFFLGFFVLARMVPDKETSLGAASKRLPSNAHSVQIAQKSALPAASEAAPPDSVPTRPKKPVDSSDSVVTIEPADEITAQKPRDIDQASKPLSSERERKAASSAGDAAETKEPKKEPEKSAGEKNTPDTPLAAGDEPAGTMNTTKTSHKTRKTRKSRKDSVESSAAAFTDSGLKEGDQKPSQIDPGAGSSDNHSSTHSSTRSDRSSAKSDTSEDSASQEVSAPAAPAKRIRYRVDAGAYSRREAAEKVVQRVTDLGLEATVLPITKEDGTTVYRVQQGVYRKRSNADAAQKKLMDAGLDTDVVKTGG